MMFAQNDANNLIRGEGDLAGREEDGRGGAAQSASRPILPYSALFFLSSTNP